MNNNNPIRLKTQQLFPKWLEGAVLCQIFPDRFARSSKNPKSEHVDTPWDGPYTHRSFCGGSLDGIAEHLDYLEDLGVNLIWLNPIFESPSNHKYDTADYARVSKHFGGNPALRRLIRAAHNRGIRIILDAVCGHCSTEHFAFRDLMRRQQKSPYRDWFRVRRFPVVIGNKSGFNQTYDCWQGHPALPQFNTDNHDVQEYLISSYENWLVNYDVDGFRLDAIETISLAFWEKFRARMKRAKPDCLLLGEIWTHDYRFIDPPRMDTLTNFPLLWLLADHLGSGKISPEHFAIKINLLREQLPSSHRDMMMNFLSNHDIMRIASRRGITPRRLELLHGFLLTYPGIPAIYYGDEIGMKGGNPPDSRNGMIWDERRWNVNLHSHIRQLIHIRRREPALSLGSFKWIYADDSTRFAIFLREQGSDRIAVALHLGKTKSPHDLKDLIKKEGYEISETIFPSNMNEPLRLPAESLAILRLHQ